MPFFWSSFPEATRRPREDSAFFFPRDVLEAKSEKTKIAWPKNEQPKSPQGGFPKTCVCLFVPDGSADLIIGHFANVCSRI